MSEQASTQSLTDTNLEQRKRSNQIKILFVAVVVMIPLMVSFAMHMTGWGMSRPTVNKGELLNPVIPLKNLLARQEDGELRAWDDTGKIWQLVLISHESCEEICREVLLDTRQVHIRLGKKAMAMERVLLNVGESLDDEVKQMLTEQHPRLVLANSSQRHLGEWMLANKVSQELFSGEHYFLVDKNGLAMMRYGQEHNGLDLLKDINKLLRSSH